MLIRALTPDDQAFLCRVLYHAVHVGPDKAAPSPGITGQPELARYVDGWMQKADDLGFIVEENGMPIGAAWLRCWSGAEQGYGFVDKAIPELSMSLLPGYRGRGLGSKLLRRLLAAAEERFNAVSLSVADSNPARRLYQREGFRPIGKPENGSIRMLRRFS